MKEKYDISIGSSNRFKWVRLQMSQYSHRKYAQEYSKLKTTTLDGYLYIMNINESPKSTLDILSSNNIVELGKLGLKYLLIFTDF